MGSTMSNVKRTAYEQPSDVNVVPQNGQQIRTNGDSHHNKSDLKTRADVIKECGEPESETSNQQGFFATCYEEDCFLMGGLRKHFHTRLSFPAGKMYKIVYLDSKENVLCTIKP